MNDIHNEIDKYYTGKLREFGTTPQGVDWNSEESQHLRLEKLSEVINSESDFSILDYGCGYGAYCKYLKSIYKNFEYSGYDLSREMISKARELYPEGKWIDNVSELKKHDFVVASGIFSVMMQISKVDWENYILNTIESLDKYSEKGFAFNALTTYSDKDKMRGDLYYADPGYLFDICKSKYSKNVALLHDYGLYEFTIIVRKQIK